MNRFRKLLKRYLREVPHPILDQRVELSEKDAESATAYAVGIEGGFLENDEAYVRARFQEACRERQVVEQVTRKLSRPPARVLDVGAGSGAFELAMASRGTFIVGVESLWSPTVIRTFRGTGLPLRRVVANAECLPFRDGSFDVVTSYEALEHFRRPREVGAEIVRVARPSGMIFITTPPRVRFLLRRDPHYGVRFLALLPSRLQQKIALRLGFGELHHTEKLYTSVGSIAAVFDGTRVFTVLSRWRRFKRFLWDVIVLQRRA